MLTTLILLAAAAPITLDTGVVTSAEAIQAVGQAMGRKLTVAGGVKRDNLFIKVDRMDPQELMNELARITEAKWVASSDALVLTAPEPTEAEEARDQVAQVGRWLKSLRVRPPLTIKEAAALAAQSKVESEKQQEGKYDWQAMRKLTMASPQGQAHRRILMGLPVSDFGSMRQGDRVVYSTRPTAMQRPFPRNSGAILDQLVAEAKILQAEIAQNGSNDQSWDAFTANYMQPWRPLHSALLILSHEGFGIRSELRLVHEDGHFGVRDQMMSGDLGDEALPAEQESMRMLEGVTGELDLTEADLELGRALQASVGMRPGPSSGPAPKPEIIEGLLNLDKNGLLLDLPGRALKALAETKKKNVIAVVTDLSFMGTVSLSPGSKKLPLAQAVSIMTASLMQRKAGRLDETESLIRIRPGSLTQSRLDRLPRAELAAFLKQAHRVKTMDVDILADYTTSTHRFIPLMISAGLASTVSGSSWNFPQGAQLELLRFYGFQSSGVRKKAREGGARFPATSVTGEAKKCLHRLVYGLDPVVNVSTDPNQQQMVGGSGEEYSYAPGIANEPTHALPNGLTSGSIVNLSLKTAEVMVGYNSRQSYSNPQAVSLDQLAWSTIYAEKGIESSGGADNFAQVNQIQLRLKVDHSSSMNTTRSFLHLLQGRDTKYKGLQEMPEEFRKKLNELTAKYREQSKDWNFQPGGGRVKPPL